MPLSIKNLTKYMQINPESDFSTTYPEWDTRYEKINATLKHFGITPSYGDNSPYLAKNPRELRKIINMYFTKYYKTYRIIYGTFKQECKIPNVLPNQNIYDAKLHREHTTIDWCPELALWSFYDRIEQHFHITIPSQETKRLDTLHKWCEYIAIVRGITIPQNTK